MKNLHLQFVLACIAGWVNRNEQDVIEYLKTENEIYREKLGGKRIRFTDDQRRRLAVKAKAVGRKALSKMDCIVTPDTLFRWYRNLMAQKYDGSRNRGPDVRIRVKISQFDRKDGKGKYELGLHTHRWSAKESGNRNQSNDREGHIERPRH